MTINTGNMALRRNGEAAWLEFPSFSAVPFVRHAFSTRLGGVSKKEYASMNLAFGRGDSEENVRENYRRFCRAAGFEAESLVSSAQVHGTVIRRVGREQRGEGVWKPQGMAGVDALVTDEPGVTLVIHTADCVPVFLIDPRKRAVGLAHAGWRGTAAKIAEKTVLRMAAEFGSRPDSLLAGIGPSIGPCCFEVDPPVRGVFAALEELSPGTLIRPGENGKSFIDLWEANRRILLEAGLLPENISVGGVCTKCGAEWLFSHRASGGKRGGLAAFLELKEDLP